MDWQWQRCPGIPKCLDADKAKCEHGWDSQGMYKACCHYSGRSKQMSVSIHMGSPIRHQQDKKKKEIPKRKVLTRCKYRYKMVEGQSSLWKGGINYPITDAKIVIQKWI